MCMLCVIPPNVLPSREKLENSALNNPDGFGFAIAIPKENRILCERTMNADESINRFLEMRAKYPDGYAIWHSRLATHGRKDVSNCHPFAVGGDERTYLAHNGILPVLEDAKDERSDTRIFAEDLLGRIGGVLALDNPQVWNLLEDFTTGSKIAILTVDPDAEHQLYLLHADKGKYDSSGVWWSNDSCYLETWYSKYYSAPTTGASVTHAASMLEEEEGAWLECRVCEEVKDYWTALTKNEQDYCPTCGSCYECDAFHTNCLCYVKGGRTYDYRTDNYGGWYAG